MTSNQDDRPVDLPAGGDESYEQLLDDYSHLAPPAEGEVLMGHVLQITPKGVIVDVGLKQEGFVPLEQVAAPDGQVAYQPGDTIEVIVDRRREVEGYIALSHERASRIRAWDTLDKAYRESLLISGRVLGRVKGGLSVDVGVVAFMPSTQVDVRPLHNLDAFLGQDIAVKVIKLNRRRNNVVVSRKAAMEDEMASRKTGLLDHLHEGDLVTGIVKNLTDYGAFVDLGGIDGLLHVTDMSWQRVDKPSSLLSPGQSIQVKILKLNRESRKISLGLKQLTPDPWTEAVATIKQGDRVRGKVVRLADFGAFIEIAPGVDGLIHLSEMSWTRRVRKAADVLQLNDIVEAVVLEVKAADKRISLGLKQALGNPWDTVETRFAPGTVVEAPVTSLAQFGAFVDLGDGVEGMIHVGDITRETRIQHPKDKLSAGQVVKAQVLEVDKDKRRIRLGMKQLEPTTADLFIAEHQVGELLTGRVVEAHGASAKIEIGEGVHARCKTREESESAQGASAGAADVDDLAAMLASRWKGGGSSASGSGKEGLRAGQIRRFKITAMDTEHRRIDVELAE